MNEIKNKLKAVMIGHAAGDALGVPVEFCTREELAKHPVTSMRGFGSYPVPAGAWSDDTSMSLAALDVLASKGADYEAIMRNFVLWYEVGDFTPTGEMFDIGRTCCTAIRRYLSGEKTALECGSDDENSNGNGSLMRIHPFVLYAFAVNLPFENWMDMIRKGSALTHAHERSLIGCLIYAFVLLHLLKEPSLYSVQNALLRAECHLRDSTELHHYDRIFRHDFPALPCDEIKSSGYVVDTLEAALWCLLTTKGYRDCVLKAVNLGEDTDSIAAVAGGLAGALYGYDSIPKEWLDTLIRHDYIEKLCERTAESVAIRS